MYSASAITQYMTTCAGSSRTRSLSLFVAVSTAITSPNGKVFATTPKLM